MRRALILVALVGPFAGLDLAAQVVGEARAAAECRCAERPLEAYYAEADEVLFARLVGWEDILPDRRLLMEVTGLPWKTSDRRSEPLHVGDTLRYVTSASTATCGLQPLEGAVYALFAQPDPHREDGLRVDTCSGTRIHRASATAELQGFPDVPGRFVARRLDALGGLDVLRAVAAHAPDGSDPANETLVGLLDLKALAHGGSVAVRGTRDPAAALVATLRSYDDVDSREVDYEVPAAVVLARVDGWYRVWIADDGSEGGSALGWIAPEDAGTWFPYSELPLRRLSYVTGAWSGHVWPDAGAGIPARSARAPSGSSRVVAGYEHAVEVHESVIIAGMPWFRVDVLSGSPCEGGEVRAELSGWIPGYGARGEPVVWYYSRGC